MSSMNQVFVRKVTEDAITAVRAMFPSAEIETNAEFTRVLKAELHEHDLLDLSSRLDAEVMWLSYQSVVDAFEYYHWQSGLLRRALVYGCYVAERTWERIEGEPEAWEHPFFFNPDDLAFFLDDEDETDEGKARLTQFWQRGELVLGRMEPYLSAQTCAFQIATYYRFPGWDKD